MFQESMKNIPNSLQKCELLLLLRASRCSLSIHAKSLVSMCGSHTQICVLVSLHVGNDRYGLIIAAVHLNLPHTLVKSIVVSEIDTDDREGWAFVDALPDEDVCNVDKWSNNPRMPIILHYCGRYALGKFFFSKYRLKKHYISCEAPLLTMPPPHAHQILRFWARPPPDRGQTHEMTVKNVTAKKAKREAFMLCGLIHSVNEAARYYKTNHCNGTGNFSEIYNFHDDPYST